MYSSLFTRLLLVFALLFAQMGGAAHGVSHILAEKSPGSEQSLPHDKYCDQCEAYAQIGSAVGSSTPGFVSSTNLEMLHFNHPASCTSHTFAAFAARAPPYFV